MKSKILIKMGRNALFLISVNSLILFSCKVPDDSDKQVHSSRVSDIDKAKFDSSLYHFPNESWYAYENPGELGWSEELLKKVGEKADSLETGALMIIHKGVLVYDWGATEEKYLTQSMRKGLLNSLYGIYWDRGEIDLNATMEDLNVNEDPPLSNKEKQATIEHLLQSTSGIYHSALYELGVWKRGKPERGSHKPGQKWYYNNWGFNALGTIFEEITNQKIGDSFHKEIALPIQMQDFNPDDVEYITRNNLSEKFMGNSSLHNAYMFSMSARDMARYGLLYLNKGQWKDQQIISEEWINRSWNMVDIEMYKTLKFGYLWWVFEEGKIFTNYDTGFEDHIYLTSGNRGHFLFIIPYLDLVVVHRVPVKGIGFFDQMKRGMFKLYADVDDTEVYYMLETIRKAHPHYFKGSLSSKQSLNIDE